MTKYRLAFHSVKCELFGHLQCVVLIGTESTVSQAAQLVYTINTGLGSPTALYEAVLIACFEKQP